jgi:hypothetical protein
MDGMPTLLFLHRGGCHRPRRRSSHYYRVNFQLANNEDLRQAFKPSEQRYKRLVMAAGGVADANGSHRERGLRTRR